MKEEKKEEKNYWIKDTEIKKKKFNRKKIVFKK